MTKILVIGGSCRFVLALTALNNSTTCVTVPSERFDLESGVCGWQVPPVQQEDVFRSGGRSKGEKKRAARERRLRGGY